MAKRNKLRTPWGWEVQKQRIKITMIICLKKLLKKILTWTPLKRSFVILSDVLLGVYNFRGNY